MLRIYPRCDQKTAIQFVDYVLERLPFSVQIIQTDNGAEFQSAFHYHVLDKGVSHRYIKPRTPRLNGKVERSHRIDAEEFYALLDGLVIDDAKIFNNKLREWEDYYNYHRPHGGLNGQTPYERLRQKTQTPAVTDVRQSYTPSPTKSSSTNGWARRQPCIVSPTSNPLQRNKTHNPRRLSVHSDAGHRHPRSELTGARAAVA